MWSAVRRVLEQRGTVVTPAVVADSPGPNLQRHIASRIATQHADGPWHVVGHSFGGQVALELALRRPDLVSALTLMCTRDTPYPRFAAASDDVAAGGIDRNQSLRRWFSPGELADDSPAVRHARAALRDADLPSWAAALRAIATFDCSGETSSITCPTHVVAAERDTVSGPATMEAMHHRLAGSEFTVLGGAWHMSIFTDTDRLAGLLSH